MQFAPQTPSRVSKKMKQFLDEVNDLCEHYQYSLQARLNTSQKGITPHVVVVEVTPAKKKKGKVVGKKVKKGKLKK